MLKKRIIPCLDIKDGRCVKGVNFKEIKDAGDPVELAKRYEMEGADELVFLDIAATIEKRKITIDLVKRLSKELSIPFTVGGGVNSIERAKELILAGADKISLNTAAIYNPNLISWVSTEFGSQATVVAIDAKWIDNRWITMIKGGKEATSLTVSDWAEKAQNLGAGEILLTSMEQDGVKNGYEISLLKEIEKITTVPIIASGGAGKLEDFEELFGKTSATGALAASVFHYQEIEIQTLKKYLNKKNIPVRCN